MKSLVTEFECYSGGVIQSQASSSAGHAVAVLGWGEESGLGYWVVRHGGGTQWGEKPSSASSGARDPALGGTRAVNLLPARSASRRPGEAGRGARGRPRGERPAAAGGRPCVWLSCPASPSAPTSVSEQERQRRYIELL